MYLIGALKSLYSYLFQGRCHRHNRGLSVVQVNDYYASTMLVCIECDPRYRDFVIAERAQSPARELTEERNWLDVIAFHS